MKFPRMAPAQAQKEVTFNEALDAVAGAMSASCTVLVSTGDAEISEEQWTRNAIFNIGETPVPRQVSIPAIPRVVHVTTTPGSAPVVLVCGDTRQVVLGGFAYLVLIGTELRVVLIGAVSP